MMRALLTIAALFALPFPLFPQASSQTVSQPSAPTFTQPAFGQKLHIIGIPNGGKISEVLYRGAQPREAGISELKLLGITTIVDLRGEDREKLNWERKHAEALGMRFVQIPVSGWAAPTDEQLVQFLSLLRDNPGQKVFLHCRFGDDRTGVFVAAYRIALDHWTADQAIKEMYFFGFNGLWHPSMKSFIRDFPSRLNSSQALAPLRPAPAQP
jgi:tyrosine-protein phosphatase SIW14